MTKVLTIKEWAERYAEWHKKYSESSGSPQPYIEPRNIIEEIDKNINDPLIEDRLPTNEMLNNLYMYADNGEYLFGTHIFSVSGDDKKIANGEQAIDSNFNSFDVLECYSDNIPCCTGMGENIDSGDEPICDGTGTNLPGDEVCPCYENTGIDFEDEPYCETGDTDDAVCDFLDTDECQSE